MCWTIKTQIAIKIEFLFPRRFRKGKTDQYLLSKYVYVDQQITDLLIVSPYDKTDKEVVAFSTKIARQMQTDFYKQKRDTRYLSLHKPVNKCAIDLRQKSFALLYGYTNQMTNRDSFGTSVTVKKRKKLALISIKDCVLEMGIVLSTFACLFVILVCDQEPPLTRGQGDLPTRGKNSPP